jgi:hypothetical protein
MTARATQQGLRATTIQRGRVLDVDTAKYRLVVGTEFTKKVVSGVSWASPYQHFVQGEGVYVMPEVGSLVWLCDPSDGGMPFVLAWAAAQEEGNFRSRKMELNPGDTYLGTRDGNFLYLRRGGVVQIGGGPLSQRMYLPVNNTIKDICENYSLTTLGGDLEWTVQRSEEDTDGKRPARLRLKARQFANDKNPVAMLEMGSHDGDDDTILSLLVNESAEDGAATQISLSMTKSGDVLWKVQKDVSWKVEGNYSVEVSGNVSMKTKGTATFSADGDYAAKGSTATVEASVGAATMKSPTQNLLDAPVTHAGGLSATQPVALAPALLTWLATHVHLIIVPVPSTPTSPPVVPPLPSIASTSLLAK